MNKAATSEFSKIMNTAFNPLETKNIISPSGATPFERGLAHASTVGLGFGAIGLAIRYAVAMKEKAERTKDKEHMRAYAKAKNPIVSIDPSTRDTKKEQKLRDIGIEAVDVLPETQKVAGFVPSITNKNAHPSHLAFTTLAALTGLYGGYKLADNKIDSTVNEELRAKSDRLRNKIDKLLYQEYKASRGLDKSASWEELNQPVPSIKDHLDKVASRADFSTLSSDTTGAMGAAVDPTRAGRAIQSGLWLYALLATAASYKMARDYFDDSDPNRQRAKQLQKVLSERGKVRTAPQFASTVNFDQGGKVKKAAPKKQHSVALPDKAPEGKKTVTDPQDDYASLLGG